LLLVEAVRIDGKPRQRHLAYLASVQADRRDLPRFWYNVIRKLDRCRLSPEERDRITAAIAKKVGGKVPSQAQGIRAPTRASLLLNLSFTLHSRTTRATGGAMREFIPGSVR
jgi:hypothetical protein